MTAYLIQLVTLHPLTIYLIIVVLAIIEGPFLSLTSGALLFAGYFHFWPLYFSLMLGDLIGDVGWYTIGYWWGHRFVARFGQYFDLTEKHINKVKEIFHRHHEKILFFSKTTNGLGLALAILFTAGLSHIPFRRYLAINFMGQLIWSGLLIAIGYSFGNLYVTINSVIGKAFLVIVVVILLLGIIRLIRQLQRKIIA